MQRPFYWFNKRDFQCGCNLEKSKKQISAPVKVRAVISTRYNQKSRIVNYISMETVDTQKRRMGFSLSASHVFSLHVTYLAKYFRSQYYAIT